MRRLNLVFLAILLAVVTVFGTGMHLVHETQIQRNASTLLDRARRAETGNDLKKAEQSLIQYLNIRRQDGPTWEWYARVADKRDSDSDHRHRAGVYLVYEQALRYNPGDSKIERRCADLALELGRSSDAQGHLTNLIKKVPSDSQGQPAAAELAELKDLLGQSERASNQFEKAEKWFAQAVQHDPRRVSCYDRLARLYRADLRRDQDADATIDKMVAKNPKVGMAHAYRWRYSNEFLKSGAAATPIQKALRSAAANDIQEALKLAPDDPEVLLTAAVASELKPDAAAARVHFEKGFKLDPKNLALALGLARLENREKRLDKAEAVLRQAFQANPSLDLAFFLAETLIRQDKIDGKDEAAHYLAHLRNAGWGDTVVPFLEAEILVQGKKWADAIDKIQTARALLRADPQRIVQLDLMLAECYGQMGDDGQRLDALRRVAAGDHGPDWARIELVQALARSGKLDQAVTIFLPLAASKPEWRLDLARLLLEKAKRQPRDQRNWLEVERHLSEAEKALPQAAESIALLRLDMLAAQGRLEDARSLLTSVQVKDPRNVRYRLTMARLTQRQGKSAAALQILDQAETDLGPSLDMQLARLDYWGLEGGVAAKAAVAKLAETRQQIKAADRPALLERLGSVEIRLGELNLGRQYWRELAALQPDKLRVRLGLFDLAVAAGDHAAAASLVDEIRKAEGSAGTTWQFARAALLIDKVRRGSPESLDEARGLALKISEEHPRLASGFALSGEIAELAGSTDQAIGYYLRAVELGNVQPSLVRRLVRLLNERNRFDEINRVAQALRDQGAALDIITLERALAAMRKQDFNGGIALARQVFPDTSTNSSDHLTLGQFYMTAGRTDEAGREFRRALELGPGVPESWLNYVQYLVQTKQIDQARAAVETARKTLPADRATLALAQCSLFLGDAKQAENLVGKALYDEGKSADPTALRLAATVALSQNRLDKVDKYLDKLDQVADLSASDKAWVNRTRVARLLRKGRPADRDQALALVDQNLRNDPNSVEDQGLKAAILASRPAGRGEAITILKRLGGANQLGNNERFLLAQLYLGQRDEQRYRDQMLKLLNLKVRKPQHLAHFVDYWIGRSQLDQADRWLGELKKVDPQGLGALELEARLFDLRKRKPELLALLEARGRGVPDQIGSVADLLNRYGFAKEAEAAYKAFVARDPRQPERALVLAQFLARQDRVAEAMEILKKAWLTCPPEPVAEAALLVLEAPSTDETQKRQVKAWLAEAIRKRPDAVFLTARLAAIWIRQGRYDEAEALCRRVLTSAPDNAGALNSLAWLLSLRDQGKAEEAVALINRAIETLGENPSLADTRAVARIKLGQIDRAVEELLTIRKQAPKSPSFALHLAWAYHAKGQNDHARTELQDAEKLGLEPKALDPLEHAVFQKLRKELFPR